MNVKSPDLWTTVPAAAVYCGVGFVASYMLFQKLSHLVEYTLNKALGDYQNLQQTLSCKIIVSMPIHTNYYCTQNILIAALVVAIALKVIKILVVAGCPSILATSLLIGSLSAPILLGLFNIGKSIATGKCQSWVEITEEDCTNRGIDKNFIPPMRESTVVYSVFGQAPKYYPYESSRLT